MLPVVGVVEASNAHSDITPPLSHSLARPCPQQVEAEFFSFCCVSLSSSVITNQFQGKLSFHVGNVAIVLAHFLDILGTL